jgi:colanic acid biosynthesis protein WcaH
LIRNDKGQVLLTWRDDGYFGPAWHVPGGIVRFKESMEKRIREVARTELGCDVFFPEAPRAINQVIDPSRDVRGHFISLLYECTTSTEPRPELKFQGGMPMHGQWQWHDKCPQNLVSVHEMYRCHIDRDRNNSGISATQ